MRLVRVTEGVSGNVAGEMETQLWPELPCGTGLAWGKDELDVRAPARLEVEFLTDGGLDALKARTAVIGAQHLQDAVAEIVARRGGKARLTQQEATCRAQFFIEGCR